MSPMVYEYQCPMHGLVHRAEDVTFDQRLRCEQDDGFGHQCGARLLVTRCQNSWLGIREDARRSVL